MRPAFDRWCEGSGAVADAEGLVVDDVLCVDELEDVAVFPGWQFWAAGK